MKFSIIVPAYNCTKYTSIFYDHIAGLDEIRSDYELIIVDNGSDDGSYNDLQILFNDTPHVTVKQYSDMQSSYAARNYGVTHSSGEILVFTDIDCMPKKDWLTGIEAQVLSMNKKLFIGSGEITLLPAAQSFNTYEWYDYKFSLNQYNYSKFKTGATANLTVSRAVFEKVGGFREVISGGDRDFCTRVMDTTDAEFYYWKDVIVFHPARGAKTELQKKASRIAKGLAVINMIDRPIAYQIRYLLKNLLGLVMQPKQWKVIYQTMMDDNHSLGWSLNFALVALEIGFYSRAKIISECYKLIVRSQSQQI